MRLTVDKVKEAYEETGYTPYRGTWRYKDMRGDTYACGMGAYVSTISDSKRDTLRAEAEVLFGREYVEGFVRGFDNSVAESVLPCSIRFLEGKADGIAARKATVEARELVPA